MVLAEYPYNTDFTKGLYNPIKWINQSINLDYTMLTKHQIQLLAPFVKSPFSELQHKEWMISAKEHSHNAFHLAIKAFLEEKILLQKKIGTSVLYSLDFRNEKIYAYLTLATYIPQQITHILPTINESLVKYTSAYSLVVFGSYADNTAKKSSDIDLAIIIDDERHTKNLQAAMATVKKRSLIEIDYHIITTKEFLTMLKEDYENIGKQIVRKHLPLVNNAIFYRLLQRGIDHGFRL